MITVERLLESVWHLKKNNTFIYIGIDIIVIIKRYLKMREKKEDEGKEDGEDEDEKNK